MYKQLKEYKGRIMVFMGGLVIGGAIGGVVGFLGAVGLVLKIHFKI
jgi:hypothetical protein